MTKSSRTSVFPLIIIILVSAFACRFSNPLAATPTVPLPPLSPVPSPTTLAILPPTNPLSPILEAIYIRQPGPNARILSPISIKGIAAPTFEQNLVIIVTDINGTELVLRPATIQADIGQSGPFDLTTNFLLSADVPGRISVFHVSPRDGGIVHLSSVQVTLLSGGAEEITSASPTNEVIDILEPAFLAEISGGLLTVSGFSDYFFEANLGVIICGEGGTGGPHEICGTSDNIIAEGFATITSADIGLAGSFIGKLAYSVIETMRARVVVFALSPMDGAILHLASQQIVLTP